MTGPAKLERALALLGHTLTFSWFINFALVFLMAYMSPTKSILIHINTLGEADVELAALIISAPLALLALKDAINRAREEAGAS